MSEELEKYSVIKGTYTIDSLLGKGAFGKVYKVRHKYLGIQALKIFNPGVISKATEGDLFNEAFLLSKITHNNVVRVYEANTFEYSGKQYYYIVMEYVKGPTLAEFLEENCQLEIDKALNIMKDICSGLAQAHKLNPPIVHRDVKPHNILLEIGANKLVAKVSDFGVAKHLDPVTRVTDVAGTIAFMPPEVMSNYENTASDVYSAGIILYMMSTGVFPFRMPKDYQTNTKKDIESLIKLTRGSLPDPPSNHNSDIPKELDRIILKSLSPDIKYRYQDAEEFLNSIKHYQEESKQHIKEDLEKRLDPSILENINQALKLGKQYSTLKEAIRLMETVIIEAPSDKREMLKNKYKFLLENWRKGIVM